MLVNKCVSLSCVPYCLSVDIYASPSTHQLFIFYSVIQGADFAFNAKKTFNCVLMKKKTSAWNHWDERIFVVPILC